MNKELTAIEAGQAISALGAITDLAGWKTVCGQFVTEIARIESTVLDPKTPDEDANALRRSLAVMRELAPDMLARRSRLSLQKIIDKTEIKNK
jgi:hypothetical protein